MVLAKQTYKLRAKSYDNSKDWEDRFDQLEQDAQESLDRAEEGYKKATENAEKLLQEHMAIERLDTNIGEINTNIGEINTNIGDINTNIGEVNDRVHSVTADLSNVKTDIEDLDTNIGTIDTKIDNLKVGAVNLLSNSKGPFKPNKNQVDNFVEYNESTISLEQGKQYILTAETNGHFTDTHNVTESDNVTIWMVGNNVWQVISDSNTSTGTVFTWNQATGRYKLRVNVYHPNATNNIYVEQIKIAEGNKATNWSPCPDDVASKTDIKVESNRITSLITSVNDVMPNGNMIPNATDMMQMTIYPGNTKTYKEGDWQKFDSTMQGKEILPAGVPFTTNVTEKGWYTQQVRVKTDGAVTAAVLSFFYDNTHHDVDCTVVPKGNNEYVIWAKYELTSVKQFRILDFKSITVNGGSFLMFKNPKLEKGELPTDFDSFGDKLASGSQLSKVEQSLTGITSRVENVEKAQFSSPNLLKDTANMLDSTYWKRRGNDINLSDGVVSIWGLKSGISYLTKAFQSDNSKVLSLGDACVFSFNLYIDSNINLSPDTDLIFYCDDGVFPTKQTIVNLNDFPKNKWSRVSLALEYSSNSFSEKGTFRPELTKAPSNSSPTNSVKMKEFQLEKGKKASNYLPAFQIDFSEINQRLDMIQSTVQSQNGQIAQVTQTAQGVQSQVATNTGEISNIKQTAQGIQQTVQNQNGQISQMQQTVNGMQSTVTDASNKVSQITQTVNGMQSTVNDNKGNISTLTQKVDGLQSKVQDAEGNLSSITQKVDGIKTEVQDNKNNISQVTQTAEALQQKVTDNENNISQVTQTSTAIQQQIEDVKGNINTITSTVEGTTQRIENVEGQITEINHTVDGVEQTVQNQNGQLSSMQQNIDGFTHRVESMVGDISGANLIGNKDPMVEMTATPSNVKSENHEGYAKFSTNLEGQQVAPSSAITVKEETGAKLTQQIEIHTDGQLQAVTFEKGGNATLISKEQNTWVAHTSFNLEGTSVEVLKITSITVANATYVEFRRPKVEKGDYTDYKLSTTEFDKVTSEIKQTASGIQQTIESQNGKISQMTQTVDGMLSKVSEGEQKFTEIKQTVNGIQQTVQDNTGKITQTTITVDGILNKVSEGEQKFTEIKQTVNGIQNTVRDQSGKISQMTQTVDGVLSKVEELENGNPNLLKSDRDMTDSTYWAKKGDTGINVYPDYVEITSAQAAIAYKIAKLTDIKADSDYTLSFDIKFSSNASYPENAQLLFYASSLFNTGVSIKKINEIAKGEWVRLWVNLRSNGTSGTGTLRVECNANPTSGSYQIRRFKLEEGKEMTSGGKQFSELKQTIEGVQATVQNQEGKINQLTVRADGMLSEIRDNAGNISSFQHKIDSLQSKVTDNTGKWTQLSQTVNGISSIATDAKNQASYVAQKADTIQSKVINLQNKTESAISQLEDQVQLRVQKGDVVNQINVDHSGVRIDGRKVQITGDTYIQTASIDAAAIKNLDADKIIANKASFIQKGLDSKTGSKVEITGSGIKFSGRPYTDDYNNNYVEVNSGHLKFWAGGGTYSGSYGYMGTAKRGRFLTVTAGVVKNGSEYDRSPALALRSSGQDVLVATRQSVALSGGTVYIGNNTSKEDGYSEFYNNVYEATSDGQITDTTTTRVAIGAKSEIWLRCNNSVKVKAGNDFIVDTSSSVFLRPSLDVKLVPGSGVNIQRSTSYDGNKDIRFYYESQFGYGMNAPGLYKRTSSGSANLTITGSYNIMKTSSARKYKTAIKEIDNLEEAKKMLEISPISWIDKAEAREKGMKNCDRYVGFLADDFDDAGLTEVVDYDQDGEVESLAYDRLSVYMIQLIKDLYKKVEALEK